MIFVESTARQVGTWKSAVRRRVGQFGGWRPCKRCWVSRWHKGNCDVVSEWM